MSDISAPWSVLAAEEADYLPRRCVLGWFEPEGNECRRVEVDIGQACFISRAAERRRDMLDRLTAVMRQGAGEHEL
jgi:hypothetical protein